MNPNIWLFYKWRTGVRSVKKCWALRASIHQQNRWECCMNQGASSWNRYVSEECCFSGTWNNEAWWIFANVFAETCCHTFNTTYNHPSTYVWQEQVPLDTFRKSVKDCMVHIPEYSILHSYHLEDLKTNMVLSLPMNCVMGLKFIPDCCDKVLHAVNFYRFGFSITALPSLSLCFVCVWMSDM